MPLGVNTPLSLCNAWGCVRNNFTMLVTLYAYRICCLLQRNLNHNACCLMLLDFVTLQLKYSLKPEVYQLRKMGYSVDVCRRRVVCVLSSLFRRAGNGFVSMTFLHDLICSCFNQSHLLSLLLSSAAESEFPLLVINKRAIICQRALTTLTVTL